MRKLKLFWFDEDKNVAKFKRGDLVKKKSGSEWQGIVCGEYSTELTLEGYAVESANHKGSVQIYPAEALELVKIEPEGGFEFNYQRISRNHLCTNSKP